MKVLLENLLRNEDGTSVDESDVRAVASFTAHRGNIEHEIAFRPARVLMQDFTGVPGGGRSGGHARRHGPAGIRPRQDQSAEPGRPGDRPLGHGG
jgi:aconitase A